MFDPEQLKRQAKSEQKAAELSSVLDEVADCIPQVSRMYFMYYEALLKSGFSSEQALYLIGQHGATLGVHFNK